MTSTTLDWTRQLSEQLEWHWTRQLRPRFDGLTDAEYFWEPAQPAWNVRPRTAEGQPGTGPFTVEFAFPEPDPPPVPTIAWRLAHVIVGVLAVRVASHFGGPAADYGSFAYAGTATEALTQAGPPGSAVSTPPVSRSPAGRRRGRSPSTRWPRSCCTSTGR